MIKSDVQMRGEALATSRRKSPWDDKVSVALFWLSMGLVTAMCLAAAIHLGNVQDDAQKRAAQAEAEP